MTVCGDSLKAKLMGLPVEKLVVATNENDILSRYFTSGVFAKTQVKQTVSPSIDIQGLGKLSLADHSVPYNFERFTYLLSGGDTSKVKSIMETFASKGSVTLDEDLVRK